MSNITLIVFLIFLSRQSVDAITCYSCDSGVESLCENPEKNDTLQVACTQETLSNDVKKMHANDTALVRADFICYKMKITIGNKNGVLRGCTYAYGDHCERNGAIIEEGLGGTVDFCETCDTDLCNLSNGIDIHLFTSIVCFFVELITSKLY